MPASEPQPQAGNQAVPVRPPNAGIPVAGVGSDAVMGGHAMAAGVSGKGELQDALKQCLKLLKTKIVKAE